MDFVAVGHVTLDHTPSGIQPGGTAYYAALTAHRLGLRAGLVTSFGPDFDPAIFPTGLEIVTAPSDRTTVFRIDESGSRRKLTLLSRAADLEIEHLPEEWQDAALALLGPVINEVDPALAGAFSEAALGVLPQGWMRRRGAGGALSPERWDAADLVLPHTQLLVVSAEDIEPFRTTALEWFQRVPLGVVTRGREGAVLFVNGERYHVEADRAAEMDATGAGDVFAAAMLIEYHREGNPWDAAAAGVCAAAASVEGLGAARIPDRPVLRERLAAYQRRLSG